MTRWGRPPGRRAARRVQGVRVTLLVTAFASAFGFAFVLMSGRAARAEADEPAHAVAAAEGAAGEGVAHAETGGEHGAPSIDGKSLALQLLNFGVLIAILIKFGGGAINKALATRHEQLKTELASAATARAQAEERRHKQDARLAGLEREIAAMRAGIKREAEVEKAQLIAAAEERARRIRDEAVFVIDQQVKEAQLLLRRDVAESALRVAEEILRRAVDGNDQRRLLEGFIEEIGGADSDAPAASNKLLEKAV